jgi:PTS system ascorbate-specific IIA component
MTSLLLVAHAPLASAMLEVARHAYADCSRDAMAVDIGADIGLDEAAALVSAALGQLPGPEVLVMVDAFGATPCNAALAAVDGVRSRVVTGLNVPMLWRTLCYADVSLVDLVTRATDGARQGVMQVSTPRRQNQSHPLSSHDPDPNPDQ